MTKREFDVKHDRDRHVVDASLKRLDYLGVQARFHDLGPALVGGFLKERELGVSGEQLTMGLAGFLNNVIAAYISMFHEDDRERTRDMLMEMLNDLVELTPLDAIHPSSLTKGYDA